MDIFSQIQKEVKKYSFNAKGRHNWEHTGRAYNLYSRIGKKENVDFDVLKYATVLHDIGRNHQDELNGKICHEEKGVMLARKVLEKYNLDQEKIEKIIQCIESHRFRGSKIPQSIEAKVLFDADKLDAMGAVGIDRIFLFAGSRRQIT